MCHVHHLQPRSEGGSHDPDNLVWICDGHHRAVHDGRLVIRGAGSTGFSFEHADGRPYGSPKTDGVASKKLSDVFEILCSLGFRQTEARRMIDATRPQVGAETATEDIVRRALRHARVPGVAEARAAYLPVHALEPSGRPPRGGQIGFRQTEARQLVDAARPQVGAETATEDIVRRALRHARVPGVAEARAA
jgi:hypothetical protein